MTRTYARRTFEPSMRGVNLVVLALLVHRVHAQNYQLAAATLKVFTRESLKACTEVPYGNGTHAGINQDDPAGITVAAMGGQAGSRSGVTKGGVYKFDKLVTIVTWRFEANYIGFKSEPPLPVDLSKKVNFEMIPPICVYRESTPKQDTPKQDIPKQGTPKQGTGALILTPRIFLANSDQQPMPLPRSKPGAPYVLQGTVNSADRPVAGAQVILLGWTNPTAPATELPNLLQIGQTVTGTKGKFQLTMKNADFPKFVLYVMSERYGTEEMKFDRKDFDRYAGGAVASVTLAEPPKSGASGSTVNEPIRLPPVPQPARESLFADTLLNTLPLRGSRSPDVLALLAPGVFPAPVTNNPAGPGLSPGVGLPGEFAVNGLRGRENNFTTDGVDNNDEEVGARRQGFIFSQPNTVESIRELQVTTALADAQFGRNIGAQVNLATASGTAQFHGTAYGFITSASWNARNFFDLQPGSLSAKVPVIRQSDGARASLDGTPLSMDNPVSQSTPYRHGQFGFSMGGPTAMKPNGKTFFLVAFEHQSITGEQQAHFSVPGVADRGFSPRSLIASGDGSLYGSSVPGDAIFSLYPFPNNPVGPYGANTYTAVLPADGSGNLLSVHLDRSFRTDRFQQTLGGSFGFFDESKTLPWTGGALNSSIRPTVYGYHVSQYLISDLPWRITNTFRFSLGAAHYDFAAPSNTSNLPSVFSPGTPFLLNQKLILNLTKPNGAPVFTSASSGDPDWVRLLKGFNLGLFGQTEQITGPIGEVHVAGFSPIGVDVFHYPQERAHKTVQLGDTATRTLGAHTITAGFELWDVRLNSTMDQNSRAQVDFYGERSGGIPVAANPSLASTPLLSSTDMVAAGYPGALYQTLSANPQPNLKLHRKQIDFFLQDVWRVSQTLNLSTGIRLELNRVPESDDPRFRQEFSEADFRKQLDRSHSNCVDSPNQDYCDSLIASLTRAFPASFDDIFSRHPLGKDLRVGFAWDPRRGNTVLRGGVGRYTGQFPEILLSEARSALPQYLPLNMADPPPSGFYLSNIAHPGECIYLNTTNKYNCSTNLLHNTLSQLDPGTDLPFFFARDINRLAVLSPVQPAADLRNPYSLQYGVTLDQALWKDTMLSMAYVGTMGRHLLGVSTQSQTPNQPIFVPPAFQSIEPLGGTGFPNFLPTDSATNGFNLKPGPLPLISRTLYASGGNSAYNSLQVEFHGRLVRQRLGQVQFGTAFTYAHAIDNASDFFPVAGEPGSPQDSFQSSERASSAYDARARFAGNFVWTVPYPMGIGDSTRMASRLFQNWRLAGVVVAQTGQPFTVNTSVDVNQDGSLTDRLDQTTVNGQAALIASQSRDRRASFTLSPIVAPETLLSGREMAVGAAGGCFNSTTNRNVCDGSVGRNTFRATGMFTVDLALMRDVRLGKDHAHALHLRAECYNALNRAQFGIPVRILEAPGFGSAVSTIAPNRTIQFGAKLSF